MKNIFYIHRFPFTKEAFIRDEFEFLSEKGYNVKYLDISDLLKKTRFEKNYPPDLLQHIISFKSRDDFGAFLIQNPDSLIVTEAGLMTKSAWMYLRIFKVKIPYILFENTTLPKVGKNASASENMAKFSKFLKRLSLKKIIQKPYELLQYNIAKVRLQPALMIVMSKNRLNSDKKVLKGKRTILQFAMSLDYKIALSTTEVNLINEPYAVFIDQYFCHHPDFKSKHIVHNFSSKEYYNELNVFLKKFALESGLKIVIAAHPRRTSEQQKDFYEDFPLYYNKTAQLIKFCDLVLIHFSTAINFAAIFNKPFIIVTSDLFKGSSILPEINRLQNYFKQPLTNASRITGQHFELDFFEFNNSLYSDYTDKYLGHAEASDKSLGSLIIEAIRQI